MVSEKQARAQGYEYHGAYERYGGLEKIKERAKELRKQGNKAMVVYVPDSKYSRGGGGGGHAIYWIESEANKAVRKAEAKAQRLRILIRDRDQLLGQATELTMKIEEIQNGGA